jgi:cathepsin L
MEAKSALNVSISWAIILLALTSLPVEAQAPAESRTSTADRMEAILNQPVADYASREAAASPDIQKLLAVLRSRLAEQKAEFSVGYTTALDVPLSMLASTRIPDLPPAVIEAVNSRARQLEKIDVESAAVAKVTLPPPLCSPNTPKFDWRQHGKVNPIRAQICGTCWGFTAMGAYEGSYALRNNALVVTSEQYVLNCAHAGDCTGGWWMPVFNFLIKTGTANESDDQFTGNDKLPCPPNISTPYRATSWGFVSNAQWAIPSVQATKQALCTHGPLATAVEVDPAFQAYTGGPSGDQVFDEHAIHFTSQQVNHGVVIIGWDDSKGAWLVRNSWGPGWGGTAGFGNEKGYMWIAYNTNNVGIATAWVDATNINYTLSPRWLETLEQFKIDALPIVNPATSAEMK